MFDLVVEDGHVEFLHFFLHFRGAFALQNLQNQIAVVEGFGLHSFFEVFYHCLIGLHPDGFGHLPYLTYLRLNDIDHILGLEKLREKSS